MTTWFHIGYANNIELIDVIRETDKFVVFKYPGAHRESRSAKDGSYFKTFIEAKDYLVAKRTKRIEELKAQLRTVEALLIKAESLTEAGCK